MNIHLFIYSFLNGKLPIFGMLIINFCYSKTVYKAGPYVARTYNDYYIVTTKLQNI